jgi:hypothetical protein
MCYTSKYTCKFLFLLLIRLDANKECDEHENRGNKGKESEHLHALTQSASLPIA